MSIATVNPYTGETVRTFRAFDDAAIERALDRAARTFRSYRRTSIDERAAWLNAAADILESERDRWARLMTLEMGKPIAAARAEAEKCATGCRWYAEHGAAIMADERASSSARESWVRYDPIGPVLAIMPWNFPFWQVFRFAAPALMAGNVGLLKHASNVPQCALAIEEILRRAGFPEGAFQTLLIGSDHVERIIADDRIAGATLTGSEGAGRAVGAAAGRAIKPSVLELGGSDPFIVMPSADIERAARVAVTARTINNGQSCIAAKRFIVHEDVFDEFRERFVSGMRSLRLGDPLDESTQVGPLATESIRNELAEQVERTVEAGAKVLTGGAVPDRTGWFYEPTVLENAPDDSPAARDELFGPVATLFRARDLDHALKLANGTTFGLGASAWTEDDGERERLIQELESGLVFINAMVASDPNVPFGGVKRSGYGRELAAFGLREFVNVKTVWVGGEAEALAE